MTREHSRLHLSRRLVGAGVALVLLVALGGWYVVTSRTVGAVDVQLVGEPECRGAKVVTRDREPAIVAQPGMQCLVRARVANDSSREVTLARVTTPLAGPETGALVQARSIASIDDLTPGEFGVDVSVDTEIALASGESSDIELVLVFHEGGCQAAGVFGATDWPRVEVSVWGRTIERDSVDDLQVVSARQQGTCAG